MLGFDWEVGGEGGYGMHGIWNRAAVLLWKSARGVQRPFTGLGFYF